MTDPINNTVCIACGSARHKIEALGVNSNDSLCGTCRMYQQRMIQRKAERDFNEQKLKREQYFKGLYG